MSERSLRRATVDAQRTTEEALTLVSELQTKLSSLRGRMVQDLREHDAGVTELPDTPYDPRD